MAKANNKTKRNGDGDFDIYTQDGKTKIKTKTRKQFLGEWSLAANQDAAKHLHGDEYWFLIRSAPQKEMEAHQILSKQGVPTYLPLKKRYRFRNRHTRTKDKLYMPLVPCYLFAECSALMKNWHDLVNSRVVSGVAGANGGVIKIPSIRLKSYIMGNVENLHIPNEHRFMQSHYEFGEGDEVQIISGSLAGFTFEVSTIKGKRAKGLIDMFGRLSEIAFDIDNLQKVA